MSLIGLDLALGGSGILQEAHQAAFEYRGDELTVFKHAINWKRYLGSKIRRYLGSHVLEVGAGIGGTTAVLCTPAFASWTAIEPDAAMVCDLQQRQMQDEFPKNCIFRAPSGSAWGSAWGLWRCSAWEA